MAGTDSIEMTWEQAMALREVLEQRRNPDGSFPSIELSLRPSELMTLVIRSDEWPAEYYISPTGAVEERDAPDH